MRGMLAHQGEELLIPALIVALVLAGPMLRQRLGGRSRSEGRWPHPCSYCGAPVTEGVERCGECGFRVRR